MTATKIFEIGQTYTTYETGEIVKVIRRSMSSLTILINGETLQKRFKLNDGVETIQISKWETVYADDVVCDEDATELQIDNAGILATSKNTHTKEPKMTITTFSISNDHGHYYGRPGYEITITDGHMVAKSNADLVEIRRLVDLNGIEAVAGGDVMIDIAAEAIADLAILESRIAAVNNSTGTITVFKGNPFVQWELPLGDEKLQSFLKDGLNYNGTNTPQGLLAELRQRHNFETPLSFTDRGWSYTTWSGTILSYEGVNQYGDRVADALLTIRLPLDRTVHQDGRKGHHFQLLR